jgi:hypothetical protein
LLLSSSLCSLCNPLILLCVARPCTSTRYKSFLRLFLLPLGVPLLVAHSCHLVFLRL